MHTHSLERWRHPHTFGQERFRPGERRTQIVIAITATMMVVEIAAGLAFGSMALLADGLHMGSHTAALGIAAFAYAFARRRANDPRFSFGTGKVNALGGFTGAILLAGFAAAMVIESIKRLFNPVVIVFDQAILVAFLGLIVNGASMVILGGHHGSHEAHEDHDGEALPHHHTGHHGHDHGDHNLRSAYLHVLADALTSLLAIFALLAGKLFGANWLDPTMGVVGAVLVARWSWGLLRQSGQVLLDREAPEDLRQSIIAAIEADADNRVSDLHVWSIGPEIFAVEVALVTAEPRTSSHYKALLRDHPGLAHVVIEVNHCESG